MSTSQDTSLSDTSGVSLVVNAQYTKDLSFECPQGVLGLLPKEKAPEIDVTIRVNADHLQETIHEVVLELKCQAKDEKGVLFLVELHYAGVFTITGAAPEALSPILLIECPRLLFPFARSIVADVTRDSGFSPLVLSPVNFVALYEQHMSENAEKPALTH